MWIDPVRRGLDVIPRYNPKVVEGTMRTANEINYVHWRMRTRWEHGTEYRHAEAAEMPDAFLQFMRCRFESVGKRLEDYFVINPHEKQSRLHLLQSHSDLPSFKTYVFDYKRKPALWTKSLTEGLDQGDAEWRPAYHGTRMECVFATAIRERLEPGPRFKAGQGRYTCSCLKEP